MSVNEPVAEGGSLPPETVPEANAPKDALSPFAHRNRELMRVLEQFHQDLQNYIPQIPTDDDTFDLIRIGDILDFYLWKMNQRDVGDVRGSLRQRIQFIKFAPIFAQRYAALRLREQHEEKFTK